jgi:dihydrofolate reductase
MEAILATDMSGGLSKDDLIPWKSKKDMQFFYQKTKNNIVIMGRSTYFSLPKNIRPLKDRLNIVLTKDPKGYMNDRIYNQYPNLLFTDDENIHLYIQKNREKLHELYNKCGVPLSINFKIFFIGGKNIYEKYIPLCETVWHTTIKADWSCDLFFNYDYQNQFKDELVVEDDELKIVEWKKIFN